MRQRKAKDLEKRLAECREIILLPEEQKKLCESGDPAVSGRLFAEIGCGKGQFIIQKALADPKGRYIGIEGQETVILRAAEKAMEVPERMQQLGNLRFMNCFVHSMSDIFTENSLDGVYLNFSDPWPKARHAKRRLTYHKRLLDYAWAIKPDGFIEIKTDNDGLFEFTLEEIRAAGTILHISEMTRDLHAEDCTYEAAETTTEYEDKFSAAGKNINYVKIIIKKEK